MFSTENQTEQNSTPMIALQPETPASMTRISSLVASVKNLEPKFSDELICPNCYGSGMEYVAGGRGVRPCGCRREKQRLALIEKIPERNRRYGLPELAELKPFVPDEHDRQKPEVRERIKSWQAGILEHVRRNPFRSLNLCSKNKCGKSQIAFAILLGAFDAGRQVKFFKMKELLADFANAARQSFSRELSSEEVFRQTIRPRLTVDELTASPVRYSILIDEFHNWILSGTEAQFTNVFETLDAIKGNGHQLILLSNYPFKWLRDAMHARKKTIGEQVVYVADAIVSRINEEAETEELFW